MKKRIILSFAASLVIIAITYATINADTSVVGDSGFIRESPGIKQSFPTDKVSFGNTSTIIYNKRLGIDTPSPEFKLDINHDGGIIARGAFGNGTSLHTSGTGTRFFWYPKKSALRSGTITGTDWDEANIGTYSAAFGYNNKASGSKSFIGSGSYNISSGDFSVVSGGGDNGFGNTSSGMGSTIGGGFGNLASGDGSTVVGGGWNYGNSATGLTSTVGGGDRNLASGQYCSVFGGEENTASANYTIVGGGYRNVASGLTSIVVGGHDNLSSGVNSFISGGDSNISSGFSSGILGGDNNISGGDYSIASGNNTQLSITADRTIAFGYGTTAIPVTQPDAFIVYGESGFNKKLGIQTLTPRRTIDVFNNLSSQIRLTYADNSIYTDMQTTSLGDLTITPSGGIVYPSGGIRGAFANISSGSPYTITKYNYMISCHTNTSITFKLPAASVGNIGRILKLKKTKNNINKVFINTTTTQTIDSAWSNYSGIDTFNEAVEVVSDGTGWKIFGSY